MTGANPARPMNPNWFSDLTATSIATNLSFHGVFHLWTWGTIFWYWKFHFGYHRSKQRLACGKCFGLVFFNSSTTHNFGISFIIIWLWVFKYYAFADPRSFLQKWKVCVSCCRPRAGGQNIDNSCDGAADCAATVQIISAIA